MPRKLKRQAGYRHVKTEEGVERVEARRSVVLRLMLQGVSPRRCSVSERGEDLEGRKNFPCSKGTPVEDDRRAMHEEVRKA